MTGVGVSEILLNEEWYVDMDTISDVFSIPRNMDSEVDSVISSQNGNNCKEGAYNIVQSLVCTASDTNTAVCEIVNAYEQVAAACASSYWVAELNLMEEKSVTTSKYSKSLLFSIFMFIISLLITGAYTGVFVVSLILPDFQSLMKPGLFGLLLFGFATVVVWLEGVDKGLKL